MRTMRPTQPCSICGGEKPRGRGIVYCDPCRATRREHSQLKQRPTTKRWERLHRDRRNYLARKRYAADPERFKIRNAAWQAANPEKTAAIYRRNLLKEYGLVAEEYDALLAQQGGVCAICGRVNPDGRPLYIDHDHATGRVRGLLCRKCNTALGLLSDDAATVRVALAYLDGSIARGLGRVRVERAILVAA